MSHDNRKLDRKLDQMAQHNHDPVQEHGLRRPYRAASLQQTQTERIRFASAVCRVYDAAICPVVYALDRLAL